MLLFPLYRWWQAKVICEAYITREYWCPDMNPDRVPTNHSIILLQCHQLACVVSWCRFWKCIHFPLVLKRNTASFFQFDSSYLESRTSASPMALSIGNTHEEIVQYDLVSEQYWPWESYQPLRHQQQLHSWESMLRSTSAIQTTLSQTFTSSSL